MMSDNELAGGSAGWAPTVDEGTLEDVRLYVANFLATAGLDLDVEVEEEEEAVVVALDGPDNEILLTRKAEGLDALQLVLAKMLLRAFQFTKSVLVDCADYRRGREREIVEIAHRIADKVKRLGEAVELSPMNPYERRIVHLALAGDAGVRTSSSGEGLIKRVRIELANPHHK